MTDSIQTPYNWSLQSIPAAFGLGLVPHLYYTSRLMLATQGKMSIAHPRQNLDLLKGKLPPAVWNQLSRLRGAHLNSMEVFPLFAAAMVAGNVAKLPTEDLNSMALSFLATRSLYMVMYTTIKSDILAYARTGMYAWSIGIPLVGLWRAGQALA